MGRRRAKLIAGTRGKPFDEPVRSDSVRTQKAPAPRGCVPAGARFGAALARISDTLFAQLLADRLAGTQRRLFPSQKIWLQAADAIGGPGGGLTSVARLNPPITGAPGFLFLPLRCPRMVNEP